MRSEEFNSLGSAVLKEHELQRMQPRREGDLTIPVCHRVQRIIHDHVGSIDPNPEPIVRVGSERPNSRGWDQYLCGRPQCELVGPRNREVSPIRDISFNGRVGPVVHIARGGRYQPRTTRSRQNRIGLRQV